ncbi:MAG TPA: PAS domain S-box protein [Methylophilus sp.]|nr:PAS domain S-box protein [Methylophilus sp.]HQQ33756.1 PAS domain S-box protein [Methylophilus sp.]
MFANIINYLSSKTALTRQMVDEITEFRTLKKEINKARCVLEFNANGSITFVNENALKSLGYAESELLNEHHRVLIDREESGSSKYEIFWENLAAGITQTGQFKLKDKKGSVVWFQGYYAPVINAAHKLVKVVCYLTDITADKARALVLQGEDEALNQTFGVMECDMNANIIDCNELFIKPLGYVKEEIIGKNVSFILPPGVADSAEYRAMWQKLNAGQSVTREIKRISKDRKEYWFQSSYVPVHDEHGKPYKVVVYSYCITEQKLKNADYEGQLKAIHKTQGVIEFDLTGKIIAVNENFAAVTGYSEKEIVGNHHSMFVESSYKNSNEYKAFWDKLARGEAESGQIHRIGKGGKQIWLQATYNPIFDMNGKPYKVVKYATDITAEKLRNAFFEGQLAAINKTQGVIEFDMTGKIIAVNENFAAVTGYSEKEIVGNHHSMFVEPAYKNSHEYKAFWDKLNRGEADIGQYKRICKSGKEVWLQAIYNPIIDMNGKPFKVVKYATDITEQHNSAVALENAVNESQAVIQQAKEGDLTERVSLQGKTGAIAQLCEGINALMDKFAEVVIQVKEAGETINTAAGEISSGNNDLSGRTEQQASNLEKTASSMEELASTVKQNADNAKQANQLAAAASGVAVKGGEVVANVVTTMSEINESSRKIEDIISVIDGIAFQTNILALNAAVEAARAGEQGRGFAVVAGEVRNLAQRSASAAKEIKELITDSVNKTAEGTKLVEDAGKTMEEIVSSVQRVTDIMGEISAASSEQSAGINQVNDAITSMDEVTQQNAALVEEAAAAAESLVEQAASLMDTVNGFTVRGGATERRAANSPMRRPASHAPVASRQQQTPKPAKPASLKTGTDDGEWEEF